MSVFSKRTIKIALSPGATGPCEYAGWVLNSCPILVVTPDSEGRDCYTLTHAPTGYSIRRFLRLSEARKLATDLAPLVAEGWNTTDPARVATFARAGSVVWTALISAPGAFY
jgi:hypothetical protein